MKLALSLLLIAAIPFSSFAQSSQMPGLVMRGFLSKDIDSEQKLEKQAQAVPDSTRLRKNLEVIAGKPHNAGSPNSKAMAEYILGQLKSFGLDAHIEQFEALMPYPTVRRVEVLGPKPYVAKLKESALPQDPTSGQSEQLPVYNAYGASGDVTGEVVYANFGIPQDYEWLRKQGIDVKGKIVITRYGKSWRGIKPKVAAEHGAIACLIYSDPHEDGYFEGDTFPQGPNASARWRAAWQRARHAALSGRSAVARLGFGKGQQASGDLRGQESREDSGASYLL